MNKTCYRCSNVNKRGLDYKHLLFFSPIILRDFGKWDKGEITKKKNISEGKETEKKNLDEKAYDEDFGEQQFYAYIEKKRNENNDNIEKTYKEIYLDFYLCEKCHGLHNIDFILFQIRDNTCYSQLTNTLTYVERKRVNEVLEFFQTYILKNITTNIDIILFFLYLDKEKIEKGETKNITYLFNADSRINDSIKENTISVTLEMLNNTFEEIRSYLVMHLNIENNYIKSSIHKLLSFVLLYVYFKFYKRIYNAVDIKGIQLKHLMKLYKNTKLIWHIELKEQYSDMKKNKNEKIGFYKRDFSKSGRHAYRRKKEKKNHNENEQDIIASNKTAEIFEKGRIEYIDKEGIRKEKEVEKMINNQINVTERDCPNNCTGIQFMNIYISFNKLCICGCYNKYSKSISQTKWFVNEVSKSAMSIEECITEIFKKIFFFSSAVFIGSGREDKDVRMMNIGRPFVLILNDTKFSFLNFYLFFKKLTELEYSNTCSIKTLPEIKTTLLICLSSNESCGNNIEQYKKQKVETDKDESQANEVPLKQIYALIRREDTGVLYDIETNKIISEEHQETIYKEKKFKEVHIYTSYNKEVEELLCNATKEEHSMETFFNEQKLSIGKKKKKYINDLVEVKLNNLVFSTDYKLIKKIMKYGTERKKAYKCLIYHAAPMDQEKIKNINTAILNYEKEEQNKKYQEKKEKMLNERTENEKESKKMTDKDYILKVFQKTPIRVLHRRSLLKRERKIYEIQLVYVHIHCSLLYILSESGLYIKEFVSGDKGRTFPNLKHFFNSKFVNVLNLDVSKLVYN